ncbi:MAG: 7-cyano-7-deazaguanine synthase [Elusimicrobia bacterium]|nr:7-cyano-7-deazaguanine synthase [Elusimicrobiota bacterium]
MSGPRLCSRCVLPHSPPEIALDGEGVCNLCREHERRPPADPRGALLESDFVKILEAHRGKHEFDCLVMCSGGKDSTAALYYAVRRYKLKVLAFTFDHGFETEDAMANVRRAVERLDVPFLTYRSTFMHDMFARIIKTGAPAVICHVCAIWYMRLTYQMAARFDAPLIIAGWTKGQMTQQPVLTKCACNAAGPEYARMGRATAEFLAGLEGDPKYGDFPRSIESVVAQAAKKHKCLVLSPHWFLPYEVEEYVALIQKELGWQYPRLSYPAQTTNCALNFLSVHWALKHYGYTHYHVEMSKLIREGLLTRAEALAALRADFDPELLQRVARQLGCAVQDQEAA